MFKRLLFLVVLVLLSASLFAKEQQATLSDTIRIELKEHKLTPEKWKDYCEGKEREEKDQLLLQLFNYYTESYIINNGGSPQPEIEQLFLDLPIERMNLLLVGCAVKNYYCSPSDLLYTHMGELKESISPEMKDITQTARLVYSARKRLYSTPNMNREQWDKTATELLRAHSLSPMAYLMQDIHKALRKSGRKKELYFWDYYDYIDGFPPSFMREMLFRIRALFLGKKADYSTVKEQAWNRLGKDLLLFRKHHPLPGLTNLDKTYTLYSSIKKEYREFTADGKNHAVVLLFSTDCSHCTRYFESLKAMEQEWQEHNENILLYALGSDYYTTEEEFLTEVKQYGKKKKIEHDFLYDLSYDFYRDYRIISVPVILIFSPEGTLLRAIQTSRDGHIEKKLRFLINDLIIGNTAP